MTKTAMASVILAIGVVTLATAVQFAYAVPVGPANDFAPGHQVVPPGPSEGHSDFAPGIEKVQTGPGP